MDALLKMDTFTLTLVLGAAAVVLGLVAAVVWNVWKWRREGR